MKILIPNLDSRVAPRFDCADAYLLYEVDSDGNIVGRKEMKFGSWVPL